MLVSATKSLSELFTCEPFREHDERDAITADMKIRAWGDPVLGVFNGGSVQKLDASYDKCPKRQNATSVRNCHIADIGHLDTGLKAGHSSPCFPLSSL